VSFTILVKEYSNVVDLYLSVTVKKNLVREQVHQ